MKIPEINDLDLAFGGDIRKIMPKKEDIPKEFEHGNTEWNKLISTWFFCGLKNMEFIPKDGVDKDRAMRHVKAIMGSWAPKHEDKEAACAYLMSIYFKENPKYERAKSIV